MTRTYNGPIHNINKNFLCPYILLHFRHCYFSDRYLPLGPVLAINLIPCEYRRLAAQHRCHSKNGLHFLNEWKRSPIGQGGEVGKWCCTLHLVQSDNALLCIFWMNAFSECCLRWAADLLYAQGISCLLGVAHAFWVALSTAMISSISQAELI